MQNPNTHNYINTYKGKFEAHPQKDILNYLIHFDNICPEYRISRYMLNEFEDFSSFVKEMMPYTSYGKKHHNTDTDINIKEMFDYGLNINFIYNDINENTIFNYEKYIEKQKEIHSSLEMLDGMCMCIHEYNYDDECCDNIDIDKYMCVITNNNYFYNDDVKNLLGFEYNHMTHTKYTPFIFSYDEFKKSVDKRNMIIKEYDGKSLYSIFFDDIIEEFEQTEQIEYDGNQLEFMCSSKKYYYHVIARR